jgi:hypothetical protein
MIDIADVGRRLLDSCSQPGLPLRERQRATVYTLWAS